jgi:hypothetical protein
MTKHVLLTFTLLSTGAAAQAQIRFSAGPQLGYTLATTDYQLFAYATYDTHYRSGFSGGFTGELGLGHLFIRPAVLYVQKGYTQEETRGSISLTTASHVRTDYLTIPLNIGFTQHRDGQGIQVFAGPYLGLILGGHYTRSNSSPSTGTQTYSGRVVGEHPNPATSDELIRGTDFGLQGGVGYRYQRLLAQLDYSRGLLNADPNRSGASSFYGSTAYHNRVFQFSLAYLFGPKS